MTDLVTRLRALAKIAWDADRTDMEDALREAADTLELFEVQETALIEAEVAKMPDDLKSEVASHMRTQWKLAGSVVERDALKAKLAEAEQHSRNVHDELARTEARLRNAEFDASRTEKAEAEAASLREAAQAWLNAADQAAGRAPVSQEDAHRLMYAVMDAAEACRSTLSQPGPGAALLERVKKPCPKCGHRNEELP